MTKDFILIWVAVISAIICSTVFATDLVREQSLASDLSSRPHRSENVLLKAGGAEFSALLHRAIPRDTLGSIVLLPHYDKAPDSAGIMQALARRLPLKGWTSLSIQPPVRESTAGFEEWVELLPEGMERIRSAIEYLRQQDKNGRITLIGQGSGALLALRYLASSQDSAIQATVLLNLPKTDSTETDTLSQLGNTQLPLLEIFSGAGRRGLDQCALVRKQAARQNGSYRQTIIADAKVDAQDVQDHLINYIHGWLKRLPASGPAGASSSGIAQSAPRL